MGIYKFVRMTCDRCGMKQEYAQPAENEPINPTAEWETVEIPFAPLVIVPESHDELVKRRTKTLCPKCSMDMKRVIKTHNVALVQWFERYTIK